MRPRSSEARRRRPGAFALTTVAGGLAAAIAIEWPATPPQRVASIDDEASPAATNPWVATFRGVDLSRGNNAGTRGDAASIDPFASSAPATGAKPIFGAPRLRLSAPASLAVGDMDDIVVSFDTPVQVSRLSFKVSMNADVLQAQSGAQGDWTADPHASFDLDLSPSDDHVAVHAAAGHVGEHGLAGSVARIRVQAMAAGATRVQLTDIVGEDDHGRTLAVLPVDASAELTAVAPSTVATADAARGRSARVVGDMTRSD